MIREGTRAGQYRNASDFCRELQVVRRTVLRDLDFLRFEEEAPIEYDPSQKGYYLGDATWNLPPVQVSRQEIFAFSIARKLLDRFQGTSLELGMKSVLDKIGESLEGQITVDAGTLTDHFTVLHEDYVVQDPEIWKTVARCVERREAMAVRYQKFNGEEKSYRLEPYHLLSYHGNWYVLAKQAEKERPATFAVSRLRSVKGTGEFFSVPAGFDIQEHLGAFFGVVQGNKVMDVRLLFSKNVAAYLRERVWHPSQQMRDRRDGTLELRIRTAGWKELVRWILSWQPDVKVLAPARLRARVQEKMRQALGVR